MLDQRDYSVYDQSRIGNNPLTSMKLIKQVHYDNCIMCV